MPTTPCSAARAARGRCSSAGSAGSPATRPPPRRRRQRGRPALIFCCFFNRVGRMFFDKKQPGSQNSPGFETVSVDRLAPSPSPKRVVFSFFLFFCWFPKTTRCFCLGVRIHPLGCPLSRPGELPGGAGGGLGDGRWNFGDGHRRLQPPPPALSAREVPKPRGALVLPNPVWAASVARRSLSRPPSAGALARRVSGPDRGGERRRGPRVP